MCRYTPREREGPVLQGASALIGRDATTISSLDILCPNRSKVWTPVERSKSGEYLEDLSAQLLSLLNTRDYDGPILDHLSPTLISEFEGVVVGQTREEHITTMRATLRANPQLRVEITGTASVCPPGNGEYATTWVFMSTTNFPHQRLWKESVKFLAWEKRNGKWMCVKHVGVRGLLPLDGFVTPVSSQASSPDVPSPG